MPGRAGLPGIEELGSRAVDELDVPEDVKDALRKVSGAIATAYRDSFVDLLATVRQQASALERIQRTLNILVEHVAPELAQRERVPVAFSVAREGDEPDLARAIPTSDPIGAGFTLSQSDLAKALRLPQSDVSILVRAFRLVMDGQCAVIVRQRQRGALVNYHPRAIDRFLELVRDPPAKLTYDQRTALERVRNRLADLSHQEP